MKYPSVLFLASLLMWGCGNREVPLGEIRYDGIYLNLLNSSDQFFYDF